MHYLALFLLQSQPDADQARQAMMAMAAIIPIMIIVVLIFVAIIILPFWFICKKAGFSPWLSLLNVVPLGGLILMYVLAFAEWKVVPVPQAVYPPVSPTV
jgi:flagellar basal body-associated protein FliL